MNFESLRPWLALSSVPGLSGANWRRLCAAFGSPAEVLRQPLPNLARVVDPALAQAIRNGTDDARLESVSAWMQSPGRSVLTIDDARYPELLRETPDPPPLLYALGRLELLLLPAIALVGSRNASAQGMRNAEAFARALSAQGLCIVSGLALGIDTASHHGGLSERGGSIAVLGCGIDTVYPPRNAELFQQLAAQGLILSEFALGTPPAAFNFPRRNRVIAGLSRGCLVIEAALASGSLITARIAVDIGRDVFAIPGSIHSPLSKGCHQLIKQGAKLVDDAADVLEELGLERGHGTPAGVSDDLEPEAARVLAALGHDPCDLDSLSGRIALPVERLLAILTQLELDHRISRTSRGSYQRLD